MKRALIIGGVIVALMGMLALALVLGVMVTPVRAQIGHVIGQALQQANVNVPKPLAVAAQPGFAAQGQTGTQPQFQLKDEKGVLVAGIFVNSPADKAGLVRGDIILDVDGTAINTYADLRNVLSSHKAGDTLKLTVQHGDAQKSVSVTLAEPPTATTNNGTNNGGSSNNGPQGQPHNNGKFSSLPFIGIIPSEMHGMGMRGDFDGGKGFNGKPGAQTNVAGARIMEVATGSPAEKAGLKVGDVINSVDGTAIDAQNSLQTLLANHKPGDSVKLNVTTPANGTNGSTAQTRDVTVTLGDNPNAQGKAYLGVSVAAGGRFHNFFGVPNGRPNNGNGSQNGQVPGVPGQLAHPGAVIDEVTSGGPAEKAGLKAGQFIQAVDGKTLTTGQDLVNAVSSHKPGDVITLTVFNPGNTTNSTDVKVTLGENPQKAGAAWLGIRFSYIDMQPSQQPGAPTQNLPQG